MPCMTGASPAGWLRVFRWKGDYRFSSMNCFRPAQASSSFAPSQAMVTSVPYFTPRPISFISWPAFTLLPFALMVTVVSA